MKRRWLCMVLALLLLLSLVACGAASGSTGITGDAEVPQRENGAAAMDAASSESTADFSTVRENAKLILSADFTLETQEYDATCAALEQMTAEAGGYIQSSGNAGEKGSRTANYTLRVPQERFETFFAQLGETCHVVSANRWSEDVTEKYTDIETRLATLQTKHERLLALLDQAAKMEDIISLENALAECEYEIDSLTGEKRHYDDLVGFSTFTVSLREVQTLTAVSAGTGFGAQVAQAAQHGLGGLTATVRGLILMVVMLWPVLMLLGIAGGVYWRVRIYRKKKAQQSAQSKKE
ncbi:DUF4349 domain-containing protein [Candidatus Agathobaculum pullicola]|uniref:DUF4349 domain-containing protein n=1 Tax=Candidatus Agathobaculum pullicola TaxID=2838426 RepID=UPI003F92B480